MNGDDMMDPGMSSLMGSPIDPSSHPANNLAPKDAMPLGQSGTTNLSAEELAEGMQAGHTGDVAKKLGSKYKVNKASEKKSKKK